MTRHRWTYWVRHGGPNSAHRTCSRCDLSVYRLNRSGPKGGSVDLFRRGETIVARIKAGTKAPGCIARTEKP